MKKALHTLLISAALLVPQISYSFDSFDFVKSALLAITSINFLSLLSKKVQKAPAKKNMSILSTLKIFQKKLQVN